MDVISNQLPVPLVYQARRARQIQFGQISIAKHSNEFISTFPYESTQKNLKRLKCFKNNEQIWIQAIIHFNKLLREHLLSTGHFTRHSLGEMCPNADDILFLLSRSCQCKLQNKELNVYIFNTYGEYYSEAEHITKERSILSVRISK